MPKKKVDTAKELKGLKPSSLKKMSDKELNALLRRGSSLINKRLKSFERAGLDPTKAMTSLPKKMADGVKTPKTRKAKEKLLGTMQRIVREQTSTVKGYRKTLLEAARAFEKTHPHAKKVEGRNITPESIKQAHGKRTKIIYDKYGNPVEVEWGTKGLSKKEVKDFWGAFRELKELHAIDAGSDGSPVALESLYDEWIETQGNPDMEKLSQKINSLYEEEEARLQRELAQLNPNEPKKIF